MSVTDPGNTPTERLTKVIGKFEVETIKILSSLRKVASVPIGITECKPENFFGSDPYEITLKRCIFATRSISATSCIFAPHHKR